MVGTRFVLGPRSGGLNVNVRSGGDTWFELGPRSGSWNVNVRSGGRIVLGLGPRSGGLNVNVRSGDGAWFELGPRSGSWKPSVRSGVGTVRGSVTFGPLSSRFRAGGDGRADPKLGGQDPGVRGVSIFGVTLGGLLASG